MTKKASGDQKSKLQNSISSNENDSNLEQISKIKNDQYFCQICGNLVQFKPNSQTGVQQLYCGNCNKTKELNDEQIIVSQDFYNQGSENFVDDQKSQKLDNKSQYKRQIYDRTVPTIQFKCPECEHDQSIYEFQNLEDLILQYICINCNNKVIIQQDLNQQKE